MVYVCVSVFVCFVGGGRTSGVCVRECVCVLWAGDGRVVYVCVSVFACFVGGGRTSDVCGRECVCVFCGRGTDRSTNLHGHNENLNYKMLTSEWDLNPRRHDYS